MKHDMNDNTYKNHREKTTAMMIASGIYSSEMKREYLCFCKTNSLNRFEREIIQKKQLSCGFLQTNDNNSWTDDFEWRNKENIIRQDNF